MTGLPLYPPRRSSFVFRGSHFVVHSLLAVIAVLLGAVVHARAPVTTLSDSLQVTYVGNEGFLIEVEGRKILIDALYRMGVAGYVVHPHERRRLLERGTPPFDNVDLLLATHHHADHYDPRAVGSHMVRNRSASFISTDQAVVELENMFPAWRHIAARVFGSSPAKNERDSFEVNGIQVATLNLHHGSDSPIENLGFLIEIGGWKLLHVGDSEASPEEFGKYGLASEELDLVFLPYWYLAYPQWDGHIEPTFGDAGLVAMHLPPPDDPRGYLGDAGGFEGVVRTIRSKYPSAIVIRAPMERVTVHGAP